MPIDAIAVVGMSGRFPKAASVAQLWANLADGVECVSMYTEEELREAGVPPETLANPSYVKAGTSIENPTAFDAQFFGFNPREAEATDPQHRLFLECCYEALEDAACAPDTFQAPIGVFAGMSVSSYWSGAIPGSDNREAVGDLSSVIANDKDFLTTRVSYKLNLNGPSVNVQTACSSSLTAVHLACQSLLDGTCDAALAGGVSLHFPARTGYLYRPEGILAPDGHCRAFDAEAAGTVPGEGCGVVVLKRLEDAVENGDEIDAVILGSAMNNDGALKVGYSAPSVEGQSKVIVAAHAIAGVEADSITSIECHGTGTRLGDPIEIKALRRAFRLTANGTGYCAIGSLKSNLGHMDAAAGVGGLIKAVLQLKHRMIAPSLHFKQPNPELEIESSPFFVNTELRPWRADGPLRAGVSSFGIGGTNVHAVLEEAPPRRDVGAGRDWQVLPFSAATDSAADSMAQRVGVHLTDRPDVALADVAYTLQTGRKGLPHRAFAVCRDRADALDALADGAGLVRGLAMDREPSLAFLLPGQGGQYPGMGRAIYETEEVFREALDRCAELARQHMDVDLGAILFPADPTSPEAADTLARAEFAQPCQFALQYSLGRLWMSWGVKPAALIGHSSGEYATAVLAGALSLEDATMLVVERGRLMQSLAPSAMTSVSLPEPEVLELAGPDLSLASVNGPRQCVVSGPFAAMERFEATLDAKGVDWRRLRISHASHSALMDPILEEFQRSADRVAMREPEIPFISNASGTWFGAADAADRTYWTRHMRNTARFSDGLQALIGEPGRLFLEIGPGGSISGMVEQHAGLALDAEVVPSMPHAKDERDGMFVLFEGLGRMWMRGATIDWDRVQDGKRPRVHLPTYPFERQDYRIERTGSAMASPAGLGGKAPMKDWFFTPVWKQSPEPRGSNASEAKSNWVLFATRSGVAAGLADRLRAAGGKVWVVRPGLGFEKLGENELAIDPANGRDYAAVLRQALEGSDAPWTIVHCWLAEDPTAAAEGGQRLGYLSLHLLAQAVAGRSGAAPAASALHIVSRGMHRVAGESRSHPEMATVLGMTRALPRELAGLRCRSVDISPDEPTSDRLVKQLLDELLRRTEDDVVALRYGLRWTRELERTELDETVSAPVRERGTYLVTGGLGGIGLALAEELGERYRANLVLIGRSSFPVRESWSDWLREHGPEDATAEKIRRIQSLESAGATVAVMQADVADATSMAAVFDETLEQFGAIHGVVHAAGLPGGGLVEVRDVAKASETLAPKVRGTLVIDDLLRRVDADFFLLCSSLSAILAGAGQADYCAANSFLDCFALSRQGGPGPKVVSVNWNVWKDTGMAAHVEMPEDLRAWRDEVHEMGITHAEGREAFLRILASGLSQVAVSTEDLHRQIERKSSLTPQTAAGGKTPKKPSRHARPKLNVEYTAPANETERRLAEIWQDLLGIAEVGVHDSFFSLGGHSLLGLKLVSRLRDELGIAIALKEFFEAPTVAELSARVEVAIGEREIEEQREVLELLEKLDAEELELELRKRGLAGA